MKDIDYPRVPHCLLRGNSKKDHQDYKLIFFYPAGITAILIIISVLLYQPEGFQIKPVTARVVPAT